MSDKTSAANLPVETETKKEEKMDSLGKKEEKIIQEEIGYKRFIIQIE